LTVFLHSAARTPYGAFGGVFRRIGIEHLTAAAIRKALEEAGLADHQAEALILGQAFRYGRGANPARLAAQAAGLTACPAWVADQGSASGLRAVVAGIHAVEAGAHGTLVVAGADSPSSVPYLLPAGRWGHRLGLSTALDPLLLDAPERDENHQRAMEKQRNRLEINSNSLISWAIQSRERALTSPGGVFPVSFPGRKGPSRVEVDELLSQSPQSAEPGWLLPPLADGAAALVLSCHAPQGSTIRIAAYRETWSEVPTEALRNAVHGLLQDADLKPENLDQVEVDETLLLSPLSLLQAVPGLEPQRLNPFGGAFATGLAHGAEGLRLLVSLFQGLERTQGRFGLAAMETADGSGMALLLERTPA